MRRSELAPEPVTIMMPAGIEILDKQEEVEEASKPSSTISPKTKFETARSLRYTDQGELGRGGMGTIRATRDKRLGRTVAAKVLHPAAAQSGRAMMFVEEAQITGQLEHPNIIPVYDLGMTPGSTEPYFTMKLVSGNTLEVLIIEFQENNRDGEVLERLLRIMLQVCDTISYAHERWVIHRDIKPQNIMLGSHGQIYVMDWGVAVLDQGRLSHTEAPVAIRSSREDIGVAGTIAYMAPEQIQPDLSAIDVRTDVFALGGIIYKILTGVAPYTGWDRIKVMKEVAAGNIAPPQVRKPSLPMPAGLCEIAMKALETDPADRYQSVDELHADISAFLRGGGWFATLSFAPGELIIRQGDHGDAGYIIVEGRCEVFKESQEQRISVTTLTAGDVFGEMAILNGETRTASVAALEHTTVKVVRRETFERELDRSDWMKAFYKQLLARFLEVDSQLRES